LMEGKGKHNYTFSEAYSLVVNCKTQEEIDAYWFKLSYNPAAEQCGWLKDKYGVSWQITPSILGELLSDPKKSEKVMAALLKMKKIDIQKLKQV
jgi:predicted 3-demethylubiquinone-9 3-methyltransferase (glyoxalase superfamily)